MQDGKFTRTILARGVVAKKRALRRFWLLAKAVQRTAALQLRHRPKSRNQDHLVRALALRSGTACGKIRLNSRRLQLDPATLFLHRTRKRRLQSRQPPTNNHLLLSRLHWLLRTTPMPRRPAHSTALSQRHRQRDRIPSLPQVAGQTAWMAHTILLRLPRYPVRPQTFP